MHTSTSGGSRESDENEAAVIPIGSPSWRAVTTVTPLGHRARVSRKSLCSTLSTARGY